MIFSTRLHQRSSCALATFTPQSPNLNNNWHYAQPILCTAWKSQTTHETSSQTFNIEIHRGILPQPCLADVASLLCDVFADGTLEEDQDAPSATQLAAYQLRLMAILQYRGFTAGRQFITVLAHSLDPDGTTRLAGVANMTPGLGPTDAEGHIELPEGGIIASLSNMAVAREFRRQGLGKTLLERAEESTGLWPSPPELFALAVYRSNAAAISLYENAGYRIDESWVDPKWLHAAERGQTSGERRYLMVKRVASWETDEE